MKAPKWTLVLLTPELEEIDTLEFPADSDTPPISDDDLTHLRHYIESDKYKGGEKREAALAAVNQHRYRIIINGITHEGRGLTSSDRHDVDVPESDTVTLSTDTADRVQQMMADIEQLNRQRQASIEQANALLRQAEEKERQQQDLAEQARQMLKSEIDSAKEKLSAAEDSLSQLDRVMGVPESD